MKKLKQLSLILVLSIGFFSCEAEKTDEQLGNQSFSGQQIFRYEIDGVTKVTNDVTVNTVGSGITITAIFKDQAAQYKADTFTITLSKLEEGTYVSSIDAFDLEQGYGITSATFKHHNVNWLYSTQNIEPNVNNTSYQTGNLVIQSINNQAKYFQGEFEYNLYAPKTANPNNTIPPISIKNGYFQYIKFN